MEELRCRLEVFKENWFGRRAGAYAFEGVLIALGLCVRLPMPVVCSNGGFSNVPFGPPTQPVPLGRGCPVEAQPWFALLLIGGTSSMGVVDTGGAN